MEKLLDFLNKLEQYGISYRLNHVRDSIMVELAIPGERWEVEFMRDNSFQIEKFINDEFSMNNQSILDELWERCKEN